MKRTTVTTEYDDQGRVVKVTTVEETYNDQPNLTWGDQTIPNDWWTHPYVNTTDSTKISGGSASTTSLRG